MQNVTNYKCQNNKLFDKTVKYSKFHKTVNVPHKQNHT